MDEENYSELTEEQIEAIGVDELRALVEIMEDIQETMATPGWKIISNVIAETKKDLNSKLYDVSTSMEETFSCKHRRHGVNLVIDAVDELVNSGLEARAMLLNNPTLEPSK